MSNMKGYYDIEIELDGIGPGTDALNAAFYLQDLKQRKLWLTDAVNEDSVFDLIRQIMQINAEDDSAGIQLEDRKPIRLYLRSCGGSVDAGFALIDAIENSVTPVYTINLGYAYSMGFLIMLAGHQRYATKNAKFLMHDGTNFVWDSGSKAQDQMAFQRRVEERIKQFVLSHSLFTEADYDKNQRVEFYLFADEAKKYGFVDWIVGEDCDMTGLI